MNRKQIIIIVAHFAGILLLSGNSVGAVAREPSALKAQLVPVHGFAVTEQTMTFQVTGFGCTKPRDFRLVFNMDSGPELMLLRSKPDTCRRKKLLTRIVFYWHDLPGSPPKALRLLNPITPFVATQYKDFDP